MSNFDDTINGAKTDLDFKLKEFRCEKKNSDWSLKMDIEAKLDKFECSVETTNNKVKTMIFRQKKKNNFQLLLMSKHLFLSFAVK